MPLLNNNVLVVGNDAVANVFGGSQASMDAHLRQLHSSAVSHASEERVGSDPQPIISTGTSEGHTQSAAPKAAAAAAAEEVKPSDAPITKLADSEILELVESGKLPHYNLERAMKEDLTRAVSIRRQYIGACYPSLRYCRVFMFCLRVSREEERG